MELIAGIDPGMSLGDVGAYANRVERLGYDALHVPEMRSDPFVLAALALEATSTLEVRTGVALAFVRSPMATALAAWSLANSFGERLALGLGPQIRPNIEQRYGMPFDRPVARMADYIAAVRACFTSFASGEPLKHEGPFYDLTRLQPEFRPEGSYAPSIWLGAVGNRMVALAGRVADGLITHPTNSHQLDVAERIGPTLREAAVSAGRPTPSLVVSPLVATGPSAAEVDAALDAARRRLAFLYSTPAYRPTLDRLGYGDVGPALRTLVRAQRWDELADVVPHTLVDAVIPTAPFSTLAESLHQRYLGLADGVVVRPPGDPSRDAAFGEFVEAFRQH
ncbi:MAG: LLM class flavin-dependent oxidoreductase [Acidimicrobiales bacterium]|nr:LLM class flavin-dependent oxidoreductase [Acidimicrobiales bacterium]